MATLFVRHTVSNYQAWRKLYDGFAAVQKAKGVITQAVYQAADNPNDVTVTHDFATLEAAQAFTKSEELRKAMQEAGVVGAPTIWFTNKV
jgi:heme-degrading monooxygenase HmoA